MSAETVRREAMMRARDSGQAAISGKVTLVQEIDPQRQSGFLLYVPVYRGGGVPETLEARRESLIGWTYAPFRSDDLFLGIFQGDPEVLVDIQVYDGAQPDPALLLHDRPVANAGSAVAETDHLVFGGREWTLVFSALPALATGSLAAPALTLLAGFILSGAIFLLSEREARARRGAESALQGLQRSLQEQRRYEERLREEGRVNSILRRLGISLAAELDPDRLAQLICDEATSLTAADFGAMFDAGPDVRLLASSGPERPGAETLAWLARSCKPQGPVRIDDARTASAGPPAGTERFRSVLTVPITLRTGHMLGALAFTHPEAAHFTEQHERLGAGIAAQASIALDNARLLRDLQDADRRKDEFLAVLGHELRNPLAPVVTALEVMKRDRGSADRQLAIIERQ